MRARVLSAICGVILVILPPLFGAALAQRVEALRADELVLGEDGGRSELAPSDGLACVAAV